MQKHLMLIHGRSFKPKKRDLQAIWFGAILHGLQRDYPGRVSAYANVKRTYVYYGDISNGFLRRHNKSYDELRDLTDRQRSLDDLKSYSHDDFLGREGRSTYERLPGASGWKERLAQLVAGRLSASVGVAELLIQG